MLNRLGTLEDGAVATALPNNAYEWAIICEHGRELAQIENRVNWQLADLCEKVRACGQYGTERMETFAREIDRGRSYVYSRAQVARFYSDADLRAMIDLCQFVTFTKCELLRRFTTDIDIVRTWIVQIEDNAWTYDQLHLELLQTFKQALPPPTPIRGTGTRSQLRDVVTRLETGDYEWRITKL